MAVLVVYLPLTLKLLLSVPTVHSIHGGWVGSTKQAFKVAEDSGRQKLGSFGVYRY
jgi:hypothetical protein